MVVRAEKVAKMLEKALDGLPVMDDDSEIDCAQAIVAERLGLTRRQATETSRTIDLSTPELQRIYEFWKDFQRNLSSYHSELIRTNK